MKRLLYLVRILGIAILIAIMNAANSRAIENNNKTLSPYFLVKSDDPNVDQLPLKSTSAEANIAGVIADVKVTQVYKNEGKNTLEAIYVFPASTRAAVYGMKMTIGNRTITAEIRERERARKEYEKAKKEGKSASLLEQQRPNVFQMNVANILPGDEIKVELSYTELLIPTEGVYEFVYPTVVGPRYSNLPTKEAPEKEKFVQTPYLHEGELPPYSFDITVYLSAGLQIQDITCTSHKVNVEYDRLTSAMVKLDPSEEKGGNRDYVLRYQLAGGKIESGLLLYEGEDENFFLLMVQPPKRVLLDQIPPRDYIFIVDVSGSMKGYPLNISKKLLRDLVVNLRPTDTFDVLLFAGGSSVMAEKSLPATSENIERAINIIDKQRGGGGTELLPALKRALNLPRSRGLSRSVIIATDGYVRVEKEAFDIIRTHLNEANMFAFGIGTSVNRYIVEGMARVGMGEPFIVKKQDEATSQAERFREYIASPVLTQINTDFGTFETYDVEPISTPDVLAERPVIIFGKWQGESKGKITLRGLTGNKSYKSTFNVDEVRPSHRNAALRYLWARHRIAMLDDYNRLQKSDERVKEVTNLGLAYNLLTAYTSFVAIDTQVRRNKDGKLVTVKQVLPLPKGVPDTALPGTAVGFDPSLPGEVVRYSKKALSSKPTEKIKVEKLTSDNDEIPVTLLKTLVEDKLSTLNSCYERFIQQGLRIRGKMTFKVTIDRTGHIISVHIVSNELDGAVGKCMMGQIKKWYFRGLVINEPVTVLIPFFISL
jgi:Ca-activated chloride channel family protein